MAVGVGAANIDHDVAPSTSERFSLLTVIKMQMWHRQKEVRR